MSEEPGPGRLDRWVEKLAQVMNGLGLNGTRLLWRWRKRRRDLAERGLRTEMFLRSAQTKHKMCASCRALVPRTAGKCPECGESLHAVRVPGPTRLVTNLIPGVTAASSLIMLVNGVLFLLMIMAQIKAGNVQGSLMSMFDPELIVRFGSGLSRPHRLSNGAVVGGEPWRLVTAIFLHGGLLHFFFNTFLLIRLGPIVEAIYGPSRFWVIYLTCGIAGSAASQLPRVVNTVGASGAIMGLIGLLLVYGYRHGADAIRQSMTSLLTMLVLFWLLFTFTAGGMIDHFNHLGGFLCGALWAVALKPREYRSRGELILWQALSLAGVLLVLFAFYSVAVQSRLTAT